jgi:hypothetical protein
MGDLHQSVVDYLLLRATVPGSRDTARQTALRDARDLLRRAELLATGARPDAELAQDIANYLPQIATLV